MFNLKKSSADQSPANASSNNALSNNNGGIRTLKKDFEDFKSGKSDNDFALPLAAESVPPFKKEAQPEPITEHQSIPQVPRTALNESYAQKRVVPDIPVRNKIPSEMPAGPKTNFPKYQEGNKATGVPSPFGSDSFYQEQSSFENVGEELNKQSMESSKKPSGKLGAIIAIVLIILLAGGAAYYWWFYLKNPNNATTDGTSKKPSSASTSGASSNTNNASQAKDTKFKQWSIDIASDKIAIKLAIKRYISDFINTASENDIIEAKLLSNDGQPIELNKFENLFDFKLPASISGKASSEYSIFVKKEKNQARMGAALKLSQSAGLSESLKNEEGSIVKNLKSFYLDASLPDSTQVFNSSKYKSADIRYFNFSSPPNTSFDYSVVSGQDNNYFIFATSKETIRSILDYMSEK
jgi:hypothetical protein